jgi:hypothetical protein
MSSSINSTSTTRRNTKPQSNSSTLDLEKEIKLFNSKRTSCGTAAVRPVLSRSENVKENIKLVEETTNPTTKRVVKRQTAHVTSNVSEDTIEQEIKRFNSSRTSTKIDAPIRKFLNTDSTVLPNKTSTDGHAHTMSSSTIKEKPESCKAAKSGASKEDMLLLLKKHNEKCAPPKSSYEPSRHSVRVVRLWEKASGKLWASLSTLERESANAEILSMQKQQDAHKIKSQGSI